MTDKKIAKLEEVTPKNNYSIFIEFMNDTDITFDDIMGYQIAGEWVAVSMKNGTTHAYPKDTIVYLRHFITE